ncbi:S-layer homology domain-containing protein [Paenibacillus contaminans]|uniref:SLH domain-containing protein n=1 Tax=Paenibacillus contaminans TaxID=450362 RepID=A0A329M460_9BACL|nr:S-layer homology domain-containing protein [Paenibacillus contaminans]RAV11757.1 hypothetical protein DQG23_35940 [Paenibacillus contaminans]
MRKWKRGIALLLSFTLILSAFMIHGTPVQAATAKLKLANPGFEAPLSGGKIPGWTSVFAETGSDFNYQITDDEKSSGSYSLKIVDQRRDKSVAILSDPIAVTSGVPYTGRAKILIEDAASTASLYIRFYDEAGKMITEQSKHSEGSKGFTVGQWQDVTTPETAAPANAKTARIMASVTSYSIANAYYDDMAITYDETNVPAKPELSVPQSLSPGQEFTVTLRAAEANGLSQASVDIQYDQLKLQFVEAIAAGAFAGQGASVTASVYNETVKVNAALNGTPINADSAVAELKFKVTGSEGGTWLKLDKEVTLNETAYVLQEQLYNAAIVQPEPGEPKLALANPGFEEPVVNGKIPGWSSAIAKTGEGYTYEITSSRSASGGHSLKITDTLRDQSVALISDRLEVTPGVRYTGKAKIFIEDASHTASLNLRFYDENDKQIAEYPIHSEGSKGFPAGVWRDVATPEAAAPENAKYVRLLAYTTVYAIAAAYFDDMAIAYKDTPAEPKLALANPGFEEPLAGGKIPGWKSVFAETGAGFQYEITGSKKAAGNNSLKITDQLRDKSVAIISDPLDAVPGVIYTGKAKLLVEGESTASLNIRFYDALGNQVAEQANHFETGKGFPADTWQDVATSAVVAPDNAKSVRLMAYTTSYSIATAYYDEMAIAFETDNTPAVLDMSAPAELSEGQEFTVGLNAAKANKLASVSAQIIYDKSKLQVVGVQPAGQFAGSAAAVTSADNGGKLTIDAVQQGANTVNGDTAIAEITFKATGGGGEAWLVLANESSMNGSYHPSRDKVALLRIGTDIGVQLSDKVYGEAEPLGAPIADTVGLFDGVAGKEDGHNVMYTTVKGIPPMFHVVDLDDYKLLRSIPLTDGGDAWSHKIAPDGTVYIAAGSQLWAYSPVTKQASKVFTYASENVFWAIDIDEDGNVYIATGPSGKVLKYDPITKLGRDYGRLMGIIDQEYARSIAYSKGYVYVGTSLAKVYKLNVTTGEKEEIGGVLNEKGYAYDTDVVDDKFLIVRFDTSKKRYIYDIEASQWLEVAVENSSSGLHIAKESLDGKIYFPANQKIMTFDVNTRQVEESGMVYNTGFRGADWVEVDDPELPGKSIVTMNFSGLIVFFNPQTKTVKSYPNVLPPSASITHVFEPGPNGKIYITGMQASKASEYDIVSGTNKLFGMGQAGSVTPLDGKIYFGVYPKSEFYVYDPQQATGNGNPKYLFNFGEEQDRPGDSVVANGKIYVGTIPDYGALGGAITVYDPSVSDPAKSHKVFRNIVQDQSIISLAYKDGKIYGGTSVNGGLSSQPTAKEAKLFVWDTEKEQKITEVALNIPGLTEPKAIGGLTIGPDGLLWGGVNGIVFAMDPDTMKLIKYKNLFPQDGSWGQWGSYNAVWSDDGLLYMFLGRRLVAIQTVTFDFKYFTDSEAFTLGADGHLYYSPRDNRTLMNRISISDKNPGTTPTPTPTPTSTPTPTPTPTPTSTPETGTPSPTPTSTPGTGTPSPMPTSNTGGQSSTPSPAANGSKETVLPVKVDDAGVATAIVTQAMFNEAFAAAAAAADGTKKLAWTLSEPLDAEAYALTLPAQALTGSSADRNIEVNTPLGSVILPGNMLPEGNADADAITLVIAPADKSAFDAELREAVGDRPVVRLGLKAGERDIPWSSKDARVTVSIPYTPSVEERGNSELITVWYIDEEGSAFAVPNGKYDAATGRVTFTTSHFSLYGVVFVPKAFADAGQFSWAEHAIEVMAAKGIVEGKASSVFGASDPITRADLVLLLMRLLELKADEDATFVDVDSSAYYYDAVAAAKALGIAEGTGDGRFAPEALITRQDMMTFIDRAMSAAGVTLTKGSEAELNGFADHEEIAGYAKESLAALASAGIIQGDGKAVNPLHNATRAETAVILYRIYNKL